MTVQEFLSWDSGDGLRYELVDGIPRAMAPAKLPDGLLQSELSRRIGNRLLERGRNGDIITAPGIAPSSSRATMSASPISR